MDGTVQILPKALYFIKSPNMEKTTSADVWLEEGYSLFASEGIEGIQIERLARILKRNKSGFYHRFGDLEGFLAELLGLHQKIAHDFLHDLRAATAIEPDFFELLLKYKVPVMFQMHCLRYRQNPSFYQAAEAIHRKEDVILSPLWCKYLGVEDNPELAIRYFAIVRDMFYTRITFKDYNYEFLKRVVTEARVVLQQIVDASLRVDKGTPPVDDAVYKV